MESSKKETPQYLQQQTNTSNTSNTVTSNSTSTPSSFELGTKLDQRPFATGVFKKKGVDKKKSVKFESESDSDDEREIAVSFESFRSLRLMSTLLKTMVECNCPDCSGKKSSTQHRFVVVRAGTCFKIRRLTPVIQVENFNGPMTSVEQEVTICLCQDTKMTVNPNVEMKTTDADQLVIMFHSSKC